jgi:eukaryotic-like serine/threonine-protein kinase
VDTVEAWMPEQIAAVKLRGFVHDLGGEVIESIPGLIRVRLPFSPAAPDESEKARGWLSMFGGGRQTERKSVSLAMVELHLEKVPDPRQSRLQISVVMRHGGDVKLVSSPQWRPWCERVCRDLRAYLISR